MWMYSAKGLAEVYLPNSTPTIRQIFSKSQIIGEDSIAITHLLIMFLKE